LDAVYVFVEDLYCVWGFVVERIPAGECIVCSSELIGIRLRMCRLRHDAITVNYYLFVKSNLTVESLRTMYYIPGESLGP
jgi:hypothetical protein